MNIDVMLNFLKDHKATICSGLACGGVFATAYFSGKAAVRVEHTIDADMDKKEKVKDDLKNHPEKFPEDKNLPDGSMNSKLLVYEPYTDQYFYTTRETIAWVMLEANKRLMNQFDVRLNYIIKMLGGVPKPEGDKIGWNWENESQDYAWSYYGGPWIELMPDVRKDKKGALCLFYQVDPDTQEAEDMIYSY